jgi:hypothetical protein
LNRPASRDAVHELLAATLCHVACLQETKLNTIDQFTASYLGWHRLNNFAYKPAGGLSGTRGGILLLWNDNYVELTDIVIQEFHISANNHLVRKFKFLPPHNCLWAVKVHKKISFPLGAYHYQTDREDTVAYPR